VPHLKLHLDMRVTWCAYAVNIGHTDFPGCFRCHDGGLKTGSVLLLFRRKGFKRQHSITTWQR
jgi:hypothetical protein